VVVSIPTAKPLIINWLQMIRETARELGSRTETVQNEGIGGESGIRTHETLTSLHAFQASAFNHSAISPQAVWNARTIPIAACIATEPEKCRGGPASLPFLLSSRGSGLDPDRAAPQ
jgi:hypothetical protein